MNGQTRAEHEACDASAGKRNCDLEWQDLPRHQMRDRGRDTYNRDHQQRGRDRPMHFEASEQHQHRNDDEAAADPEQTCEQAGDETRPTETDQARTSQRGRRSSRRRAALCQPPRLSSRSSRRPCGRPPRQRRRQTTRAARPPLPVRARNKSTNAPAPAAHTVGIVSIGVNQ